MTAGPSILKVARSTHSTISRFPGESGELSESLVEDLSCQLDECGYIIVKDYVRERRRTTREMFVSLATMTDTHESSRRFVQDAAA